MTNFDPQTEITKIKNFLEETFKSQGMTKSVVAVSGGIDSSLSLTLITQTLGKENVYPIFLPYKNQSIQDSVFIVNHNQIPKQNWTELNIASSVDLLVSQLQIPQTEKLRIGNIMARIRMIAVFDLAKQKQALVCGTENKSERYLGYFTRFGDQASDLEPIAHLYKTQAWQVASCLSIPSQIIDKPPSAGLWSDQTDEEELGFSYQQADGVLSLFFDHHLNKAAIVKQLDIEEKIVDQVLARVDQMAFKSLVPYHIAD